MTVLPVLIHNTDKQQGAEKGGGMGLFTQRYSNEWRVNEWVSYQIMNHLSNGWMKWRDKKMKVQANDCINKWIIIKMNRWTFSIKRWEGIRARKICCLSRLRQGARCTFSLVANFEWGEPIVWVNIEPWINYIQFICYYHSLLLFIIL